MCTTCPTTTTLAHTQSVLATPAQQQFLLSLVDSVLRAELTAEGEAAVEAVFAQRGVTDLVERLSLWLTVPEVLAAPDHLGHTPEEVEALVAAANASPISKREVSTLIDALLDARKSIPVDLSAFAAVEAKVRWKKHNGDWVLSGPADVLVPGATVTVHKSNGSTQTKVVGSVVSTEGAYALATVGADPAQAEPKVDPRSLLGAHLDANGNVVRVYVGQQSGNVLTKTWLDGRWEYTGRSPLSSLSEDTRLSAEQAAAFGQSTSWCCYCGRLLEDPRSLDTGYGPTCAKKYGLPW